MIRPPRVPRALFDWLTLPRATAIIVGTFGTFGMFAVSAYRRGGMEAMPQIVVWAPLVGFLVAAPVIAFVSGYIRWVDERTWAPWQGFHHAFDDRQIRVTEARGTLWFSSVDVHAALGLSARTAVLKRLRVAEYRRDDALGDVLSIAGLAAVFGRSTDRQTLRLLAWADRDVRRPWQNRRDGVTIDDAARRPTAPTSAVTADARPNPPAAPIIASRSRPIDR